MRDLLRADVEDHVLVLLRPTAVPALEQVGHHHADLAPLAAQRLLEHLREDGIGPLRPRGKLVLVGAEEHGCVSVCYPRSCVCKCVRLQRLRPRRQASRILGGGTTQPWITSSRTAASSYGARRRNGVPCSSA